MHAPQVAFLGLYVVVDSISILIKWNRISFNYLEYEFNITISLQTILPIIYIIQLTISLYNTK